MLNVPTQSAVYGRDKDVHLNPKCVSDDFLMLTVKTGTELPTIVPDGEIFIKDTTAYFGYDNKWEQIGSLNDLDTTERIKYGTNCKNCGAILHSNRCEYCGTEY